MKIKTLMVSTLIFSSISFGIISCNKGHEDSKDEAKDENKEKLYNKDDKKEANFLVEAAEIDLTEIELGKLAQQRGNEKVKEFGKMLEDQHAANLKSLQHLAKSKNISIPESLTDNGKEKYDKLNKKDDKDFNKDFVKAMLDGHKDAIDKFEKAGKDLNDAEVRTWANEQLPTLEAHLGHAKAIIDEMDHREGEAK